MRLFPFAFFFGGGKGGYKGERARTWENQKLNVTGVHDVKLLNYEKKNYAGK